ncbi:MAG: hypothetical protein FJ220_03660, partial [Kiritimatiellaceae bacterium]|nr:hypothetical protein [Kiritimatiellaceae bacterium]
ALEGDPDLGRWQTIRADAYDFLKRNTASFDLIFADPPYLEADLPKLLALIGTALAPDGLVIFEMRARGAIEIPESWTLLKDKKYGGTRMLFLQKA